MRQRKAAKRRQEQGLDRMMRATEKLGLYDAELANIRREPMDTKQYDGGLRDTALTVRELMRYLGQQDPDARVAVSVGGRHLQLVELMAIPDHRKLVLLLPGVLPA